MLFSHPQANFPPSEPRRLFAWASAAQEEQETANSSAMEAAERNKLDESPGLAALHSTPSVAASMSLAPVTRGATAANAPYTHDAPPSVSSHTSPGDTTPPSHSEAEEGPGEEADSVSSPHSSHLGDDPPLFPQTPSKRTQLATTNGSPLAPLSGIRLPKVSSQSRDNHTTPTKLASSVTSPLRTRNPPSARASPLAKSNGTTKISSRSQSRESSPESSDFGNDMNPKFRGAKAFDNIVQSSRSTVPDDSPFRHSDDDPTSFLNPTNASASSSIPPLEATFVDGSSSPARGLMRVSAGHLLGSSTQINSDPIQAPLASQAQRDEMDVVADPSDPEDRRLTKLAPPSEDGAAGAPADRELFGETMDSAVSPQESSQLSQPYSFQATQVLNMGLESQSPAKSLTAVEPVKRSTSTTSANSGLPNYRLLKRRDHSAFDTPQIRPRSPSPTGDAEQTYIETYKDPSSSGSGGEVHRPSPAEVAVGGGGGGSSDRTQTSLRTPLDGTAEDMDVDNPQEDRVLTGVHEIETGSPERDPVARPSPNKYRRKEKGRRSWDGSALSSSSSSAADDPGDNTFQLPTQTQESTVSPLNQNVADSTRFSPSKRGSRFTDIASPEVGRSRSASAAPSRAGSRPSRNKRKVFSPSPSISGASESSSAPEDMEDNSYRPRKRAKKPVAKQERQPSRKSKREATVESNAQAEASKRCASATRSRSSRAASTAVAPTAAPTPTQQSPADEPLRVLALWSKTRDYYVGTVVARNKTGYRVSFDDGLTRSVSEDKLRLLEIREGERVWCGEKAYTMSADYDGESDRVVARDMKRREEFTILTKQLAILPEDIDKHYGDRLVPLIELVSRFPVISGTKRSSLTSVSESQTHTPLAEFQGKVFLITGDTSDNVKSKIMAHGGVVVSDWESVFTIRDDSYELSVSGVPFLIQSAEVGTTMTPKVMAALAAGVPIVSARYVDAAIEGSPVWWRNFLVAAGHSTFLGNYASQDIDDNWGGEGWDRATARSKRQPLIGKRVLFIEPSAKYDKGKRLKVGRFSAGMSNVADIRTSCASACSP